MSDNSLERLETTLMPFNQDVVLDIFEGAYTERDGNIVVPERRIMLADYATAGTLRVHLGTHRMISPLELLGSSFDQLDRDGLLKPATARNILSTWGPDGPLHAYARNLLYPFNGEGREFAQPQPGVAEHVRMQIEINWDDDTAVEFTIREKIQDELQASGVDTYETAGEVELLTRVGAEIEQRGLQYADERAHIQPIVLRVGDVILGSIPNQEDWMIQQGMSSSATYESFGGMHVDGPYYDKLTPGAPDLDGFIGATLMVPRDLDVLKSIKLAFVKPENLPWIISGEQDTSIEGDIKQANG